MQYVKQKGNSKIVKKVEYASDYVATGKWEVATAKEYEDTLKATPKQKPKDLTDMM